MGLKVNDDNKVKVKVKKTKVKTKSKSNAQRGIDNSKNDINNKRQKIRKRVKKNTDLTPKVARNRVPHFSPGRIGKSWSIGSGLKDVKNESFSNYRLCKVAVCYCLSVFQARCFT